jgi:hypothetical protein
MRVAPAQSEGQHICTLGRRAAAACIVLLVQSLKAHCPGSAPGATAERMHAGASCRSAAPAAPPLTPARITLHAGHLMGFFAGRSAPWPGALLPLLAAIAVAKATLVLLHRSCGHRCCGLWSIRGAAAHASRRDSCEIVIHSIVQQGHGTYADDADPAVCGLAGLPGACMAQASAL